MLNRILGIVKKELLLEIRQKHTFYGILLYIASTIFVIYLSLSETPETTIWNTFFWIIQLFVCVNAIAKSFLQESKGRMLYYYTIASPIEFITAKLIFNVIIMWVMSMISLLLFFVFLGNPTTNSILFLVIVFIGGSGISLVFTLMSAIAAKAQQNAALVAIMGFPIILPQLMLLMKLSKVAFAEVFKNGAVIQLVGLSLLMNVLVVVLAMILFPFLWKE